MVSASDGSTASAQRGIDAASAGSFPILTTGGPNGPRLASSETVIKSAGVPGVVSIDSDSPSQELRIRLFPPAQDGSTCSTVNCAGIELDHFRIEERIGMGGMGAVFRAVDTRLQRYVALKLLAPSQAYDSSSVARFRNEARAAARLDHENIARVYYIGEERSLHFIAFEFVTGQTIREIIRRRHRISPGDTVNYALQVAYALKHTSAMGVVHRDIKPSNIIITPNGRAKLVDLGLARKDSSESQGDLTMPGTTLGTFDYISPEQAKDPRSVDVRSDIYSLGCTMFHMLTGQPPYPEGTVLQKLLDHQGKEAPDPAVLNPHVPEALSAIVRKMMNSDRNRRYQTPDQLIRDLSYLAGGLGLRGVNPEGLVWMSARGRSRDASGVGRWAVLFLLLFAVVGGLQWKAQITNYLAGKTYSDPANTTNSDPDATAADGPADVASVDQTSIDTEPGAPVERPEAVAGTTSPGTGTDTTVSAQDVVPPTAVATLTPTPVPMGVSIEGDRVPIGPNPRMLDPVSPAVGATTPPRSEGPVTVATPATPSTSVTPTTPAAPVETALDESRLPVALISADGTRSRRYKALWAACADADDGSTIELQFTGRRVEQPIRITKNITIRAARDHAPIIEFVPTGFDGTSSTTAMIAVQSGPLRLVNVQFHLAIPENAGAERYALFGASHSGLLQMNRVGVTVDNPYFIPVVLIDATSDFSAMAATMPKMPNTGSKNELGIEMTGCFFRGYAGLARIAWQGQLQISMTNTAAALSGNLFHTTLVGMSAGERSAVSLNLEHVSLALNGAIVRFSGPSPVSPPTIAIGIRNSIVTITNGAALLDVAPDVPVEDIRRIVSWRAERNFYDRTSTFWRIAASNQQYDYDQWREHWQPDGEVGSNNELIAWQQQRVSPEERRWHLFDASSFELRSDSASANPAVQGATDGSDAGADIARLPVMLDPSTALRPTESATPSPPAASSGTVPEASPEAPRQPAVGTTTTARD